MDRDEWLKTLKPGDKVANKEYSGLDREKQYRFYEIKKITPKGSIRLTNDILLNSKGCYYKYIGWGHCKAYNIEPITQEILDYEEERKAYNNLRYEVDELCDKFRRKTYDIETLKQLKILLEKEK